MIKPEYLEAAAAIIERYYASLQDDLIRDVVARLLHTNFAVSGTTAWRMEKLQEAGVLYEEAVRRIARATGKSERELKRIFEEAGIEVVDYGDAVYRALGIHALSVKDSPELLRALAEGYRDTKKALRNFTGTTALDLQNTFIQACDMAHLGITSGAFSYTEAILRAIRMAAKAGAGVLYPGGHRDQLDVAVRRAVLSGIGKAAGKITAMVCEQMGCDLVEVTAHFNARPDHAQWQGMVYSRSGKSREYPDFSVCGYGTGAGLMGWNCYHSFHPFFEGISERTYTDEELREMRDTTVTYNGETISGYEATKIQRSIERKIRESKRQLIALDEGIKKTTGAERGELQLRYAMEGKRLSALNKKLNDFCKQTGFTKEYDRARVQGFGRSEAQRAVLESKKDRLPNYAKAVIAEGKLTGYALNKEHPKGKEKAIAFEKYLGYNIDNQSDLIKEIRTGLGKTLATKRPKTEYGAPYEVRMYINGANGQSAYIKTGWIIDHGNDIPRLTSVYVDKKQK